MTVVNLSHLLTKGMGQGQAQHGRPEDPTPPPKKGTGPMRGCAGWARNCVKDRLSYGAWARNYTKTLFGRWVC